MPQPSPESQPAGEQAATVLYIGGSGRSGSTLLECLVAELPGVVVLGEVGHLWERALGRDELCACGVAFSACPFWTRVGEEAFGGWRQVDHREVLRLKAAVDRQRRMPQTARRRAPSALRAELAAYSGYYQRVYAAAASVAGAAVVVDSSKVAPTALAVSHHPDIDLRVLHIVRDSRGVAYSWTKKVSRPETGDAEDMPQLSARQSTLLWLSHNLSILGLSHRRVPVTRIRYEDLVEDPAVSVRRAWQELGLPGDGNLPMTDRTTIELHATHSVAGNPMRFRHGVTTLRPDTAWMSRLPAADRRLVTAMSYPLLRWWGYPFSVGSSRD